MIVFWCLFYSVWNECFNSSFLRKLKREENKEIMKVGIIEMWFMEYNVD